MLLIVLALFWVALLAPVVIRRFRDSGTEKSILSFHAEHEVLSRQDYSVTPAHRLDDAGPYERESPRPRLTVVGEEDTYASIESQPSWDEWNDRYEYDEAPRPTAPANRYAAAYATRPTESLSAPTYQPPIRRRSMKAQRRVVFSWLVGVAIFFSIIAYFTSSSIVLDLTLLAWFLVVGFVALALYAVSQGYLRDTSLPLRLPTSRRLASVEPLYFEYDDVYPTEGEEYEELSDDEWARERDRRRAWG